MAQDPFNVDQVQIEPGAAGTRLIRRSGDGSLEFLDAVITGGLALKQLAGLRTMANVLVVGKSGAGAAYTTVQSALNAVPIAASATNPYFILVGPGVYAETINIVRDGVHLYGFGATLVAAELVADGPAAYHTVVVQAAGGTIPQSVSLTGFTIGNIHANYACVRLVGIVASQVGSIGVILRDCTFNATAVAGNLPLWASSVNYVTVAGGTMEGSATTALVLVEECAGFVAQGVHAIPAIQLDYDSTGTLPASVVRAYRVDACPALGVGSTLIPPISSTLSGGNSLTFSGCTGGANVTFGGDRSITIAGSLLGNITLADTAALCLVGSSRGTLAGAVGNTCAESVQRGTASFVANLTKAVTFGVRHPDANYSVGLEFPAGPAGAGVAWVTAKAITGFTLNFADMQTMDVVWTAVRS